MVLVKVPEDYANVEDELEAVLATKRPRRKASQTQLANDAGLEHFLGFVLAKTSSKDEDLFVKDNNKLKLASYIQSDWLTSLNTGGLAYASKEVMEDASLMEVIFKRLHNNSSNGLLKGEGVVALFANELMCHFPKYSDEMLQKYAFVRTMVHLRQVKATTFKHGESARSKTKKIQFLY